MNKKRLTDLTQMAATLAAIISGFMLHNHVHHLHLYSDTGLWATHETIGLLIAIAITVHCAQHKFWFKNYTKIAAKRKRVTTIFLVIAVFEVLTGGVLWFGCQSKAVSIAHYGGGIAFTLLAIGHTIKRLKQFQALK